MSHLLPHFLFQHPFRLLFSLSLSFVLSSLSRSLSSSLLSLCLLSLLSLSLSIFLCLLSQSSCGVVVLLLWCGVVCHFVLCFGVRCGVWCVVCVRPKRPRVYRHHAHMLKHMSAWCPYTRRRVERTHGREGRGIVISLVFFIGKTSVRLTCLEHLNRMLGSHVIANFLLAMNGPHRFITCFRGSPKVTLNLTHFKFENMSRTTCSRFL